MQALTRYLSPYDFNPLNINPLKDLIERFVDFDAVRACKDLQLFVSATNVQTGAAARVPREEMTADMIVASACLPHLFRAVEIDGVPYWDGGYVGNPALYPLIGATQTENLLLVQINPVQAQANAEDAGRDPGANQRDHVQFLADVGTARHHFCRQADRRGQAAARHRAQANTGVSTCTASRSRVRRDARCRQPAQHRLRFLRDAAHQWPTCGAPVPRRALRRHRRALERRFRGCTGSAQARDIIPAHDGAHRRDRPDTSSTSSSPTSPRSMSMPS